MKMMDCVEVIVEKEAYARDGVHKGMQGWVCLEQKTEGYWLVNFPQCGEKDDIAEIDIREDDLKGGRRKVCVNDKVGEYEKHRLSQEWKQEPN